MPCCDIRIALVVFIVLIGCGKPSNSQGILNQSPLVSVQAESRADGEVVYHWDHHGKDASCLIALPNRTSSPVTLSFRQIEFEGSLVGVLFIDSEYSIDVGKILSDQAMIFVRPGDVIPYHDQLYHVTFDQTSLAIRQVTNSIPAQFRPNPQHLIITPCESRKIRERLFLLHRADWSDYERVRITHIAEDGSHAEYEGKPYYGSAQGALGDKTIEPFEVVHQWASSTTDVAQIVPPMEIDGVGRMRGWVEFRQTLIDH